MNQEKLLIKKLHNDAKGPTKGSAGAAGWDLYAYSVDNAFAHMGSTEDSHVIKPGETVVVHTGISAQCPHGCFLAVYARSGLGIKHGIVPSNCVGVIDEDYRGEIMVALYNHSNENFEFKLGDRIAQMVLQEYKSCELEFAHDLEETERGAGGFGSSGK